MPHEHIRQEQQPVLTPERGEVDSGLENAEQTVDVIEEHIRDADPHAGPNDVDEAVAEFVHSADGTENDLVEEQAADVGVVEMKRNPSAWRTALSFMKLPLEKVAAALRKLEPTAADQVTAVVDRAEHDIADKTVDRGGNSTGSLAGQESDNEHGGLHAGDHIPDLASTEALQSRETLQSRSERAIESCGFVRSPEVEHAITSYYEDHYKLADMIASVADGTLADEKKRAILAGGEDGENFVMNEVTRAAVDESAGRSDQLRQLYELTNTHLFREVSLPATTIGEQEAATVVALQQKVLDAARKEGVLQGKEGLEVWTGLSDYQGGNTRAEQLRNVATIQGEKQRIEAAKQSFWDDTRNAGQLLFHNTPTIDQIARNSDPGSIGPFSVSSRSAQLERSGRFNETTGSVAGQTAGSHSNLVHWSENFTPLHYKHRGALKGGHGENAANYKPGTIAVPIAEMVKQAPYARDAEYAVLDPKDSKALDQVPFDDSVYQDGNPGGSEQPGALGNDRVFLANNTDENKGINYQLDAGKGMSYEGTSRAYLLIAADEQKDIYDGMNMPFGSGENYPSTVILPYDTYTHDVVAGQNALGLQESITELNKRSMRDQHYGGKIVVPLRRGIMQFEHDMFGGYPSGVKRGATTQNTKVVA